MIKTYIKLPIPVKVCKYTGDNYQFIIDWSKTMSESSVYTPITGDENGIGVHTLEGTMRPKIGVIYGDGMFFDRFKDIVISMKERGLANTNLVVGIGGLLLQQHNRDDLGFAFKATQAIINGEAKELFKDPITDKGKRSHKGLMKLVRNEDGSFTTVDQVSEAEEKQGELQTVFLNGKVVRSFTFNEVRKNAGTFV